MWKDSYKAIDKIVKYVYLELNNHLTVGWSSMLVTNFSSRFIFLTATYSTNNNYFNIHCYICLDKIKQSNKIRYSSSDDVDGYDAAICL